DPDHAPHQGSARGGLPRADRRGRSRQVEGADRNDLSRARLRRPRRGTFRVSLAYDAPPGTGKTRASRVRASDGRPADVLRSKPEVVGLPGGDDLAWDQQPIERFVGLLDVPLTVVEREGEMSG